MHSRTGMLISVDSYETTVLREILASALKELRIESARADVHDFREALHERERIVEGMLEKLTVETDHRAGIDA